jgi:mannose-6-phosphate isomerase-like protein (cupin superfamily)
MKTKLLLPLLLIPASFISGSLLSTHASSPQPADPDGFQLWSAESLAAAKQKLVQSVSGPNRASLQTLADYPNELLLLVHREADGQAEWHETQVDVVYIQSGSATLVVGGTLVNETTTAPHERRAPSIQGGVRKKLGPGDLVRIPAKTPHQFLLDGAKECTYLVVKVKGY